MDRSKYHAMSDDQIKALSHNEVMSIARSFNLKNMSDADHKLAGKLVQHHAGKPTSDGMDTGMIPDLEDNNGSEESETPEVSIVKRKGRSAEAHEKAVEDLKAAVPEGEATETPLADIVARKNRNKVNEMVNDTSSDNIDMQIAATYMQMVEQGLVEQVINEMENILQESFNDEEYAIMYKYISDKLGVE